MQWNQIAASKFRDERQVHERQLELRALPCVHEVAVSQHGRSAPNGCALNGGDQRLLEIDQRLDQLRLRTFALCWRVLHKVLDIIARTERISRSMPKHDAYLIVFCRPVEQFRHRDVHARGHCVLLCGAIQLDAQDVSRALCNNVNHIRSPSREFACIVSSSNNFPQSPCPYDPDGCRREGWSNSVSSL